MMFDPIVDAALIGLVGVIVGIGGYALQNWQIKKAERERNEYVTKREKYEKWIQLIANAWYQRHKTGKPTPDDVVQAINEANNMLLLYGSDAVVTAVVDLWKLKPNEMIKKANKLVQEIILAMRKDLINTKLKIEDVEFLKIT